MVHTIYTFVYTHYLLIIIAPIRRNHTNGLKHQTQPLMGARRPEAAEKCPERGTRRPH